MAKTVIKSTKLPGTTTGPYGDSELWINNAGKIMHLSAGTVRRFKSQKRQWEDFTPAEREDNSPGPESVREGWRKATAAEEAAWVAQECPLYLEVGTITTKSQVELQKEQQERRKVAIENEALKKRIAQLEAEQAAKQVAEKPVKGGYK